MADQRANQETALITAALDHAWRRYDFYVSNALKIVNHYLVALAILSAGYVSGLTQGWHGIAGWIGLGGSLLSIAAFYTVFTQVLRAKPVIGALRELEVRLAGQVNMPSFQEDPKLLSRFRRGEAVSTCVMFIVAIISSSVAATYAFSQV